MSERGLSEPDYVTDPDAVLPRGVGCFGFSFNLLRRQFHVQVSIDGKTLSDLRRIILLRKYPRSLLVLAACLAMALIWLRCPTILSRATFWGEDGWVWYPQCYIHGWRCLFIDHTSYLQTISRLVALLSLLGPLVNAPKVFAWAALLMQAAPAIFLMSGRMAMAIPSVTVRVLLALLLLAIPGMNEVYVNLTNAQWHLALLAFLVLCATPAKDWRQRGFDIGVLLVSGLSGPFAIFLTPVAVLWYGLRREPWRFWRMITIAGVAAIQLSLIMSHQVTRAGPGPGLGWSGDRLINIVMIDILGVATFGAHTIVQSYWLVGQGWLSSGRPFAAVISAALCLGAAALVVTAFLRGSLILRAFLIFAGIELLASLMDGLPVTTQPLWVQLEGSIGMRYYFHPIAAWIAVLVTLAGDRNWPLRGIGVALLAVTITWAIPVDWSLPGLPKTSFKSDAKAFAKAPPGTVMTFPTRPIYHMTLTKH